MSEELMIKNYFLSINVFMAFSVLFSYGGNIKGLKPLTALLEYEKYFAKITRKDLRHLTCTEAPSTLIRFQTKTELFCSG